MQTIYNFTRSKKQSNCLERPRASTTKSKTKKCIGWVCVWMDACTHPSSLAFPAFCLEPSVHSAMSSGLKCVEQKCWRPRLGGQPPLSLFDQHAHLLFMHSWQEYWRILVPLMLRLLCLQITWSRFSTWRWMCCVVPESIGYDNMNVYVYLGVLLTYALLSHHFQSVTLTVLPCLLVTAL